MSKKTNPLRKLERMPIVKIPVKWKESKAQSICIQRLPLRPWIWRPMESAVDLGF